MINVSNQFKKAVYAPTRKTSAQVEFQIINNEAYEEVNRVVTSFEAPFSRKSQVVDKVRNMSKKYGTFETNYWLLDGTYCIVPKPSDNLSSEVGWWSDSICSEEGVFANQEYVAVTFNKLVTTLGVAVTFDVLANEYPESFEILFYSETNETVETVTVEGNTDVYYTHAVPVSNYKEVRINILKWNNGSRRARITEIDFGVVQTYDGNKLISVNLLEEMNVVGDTLPSNEIRFVVDNSDKAFNILNPQGYYKFLERNQEVSLSIGLEVTPGSFEYVSIKRYYLTDWKSDEGTLTTTFMARDFLNAMETIDYISIANTNLYALAEDIFLKAGITAYLIDPALQAIPTQGFKSKIASRKALQCIGIAGKAAIYQDRVTGVPIIRRFVEIDARTTFLNFSGEPDMIASFDTHMYADGGYQMKMIDFDNAYKEPQIKLEDAVKNIDMFVINYLQDTFDQVLNTVVAISGTKTIFFEYQTPIIASSVQISITGATSHMVKKTYDVGIELEIIAKGDVSIAISGKTLAAATTIYRLANPAVKEGTTLAVENPLINSPEQALDVGNWLASEFAARAAYSVNWRQNPAIECGDIVLIEDSFGNKKQSRITKQEYNFQGYLGGRSESKGGV
ncbi:MAG TPA: hypothetical protein VGN87_00850 [Paenibacillus sp.]|jgi:hypothetical protein